MKTLSDSQRCYLRCVDDFGEIGWRETDIQWANLRNIPDLLQLTAAKATGDSLKRRGLIISGDDGPRLTETGELLMQREGRTGWCDSGRIRPDAPTPETGGAS